MAKAVALSLNNTPIGGKKSSFYHDDIWNLKYLKGFKWDYLTERVAYERRVKEQKLKAAMLEDKRVNAQIVEQIEKAAVQDRIVERRKRKLEASGGDASNSSGQGRSNDGDVSAIERRFKQKRALGTTYGSDRNRANDELLQKVFSKQ